MGETIAKNNLEIMYPAITILPIELTKATYFKNYSHKFGTYPFIMDQKKCEDLHSIFKKGFTNGLDKYPDEGDNLNHALIINGKVYPGYNGYGIHEETKDIKLAKKL